MATVERVKIKVSGTWTPTDRWRVRYRDGKGGNPQSIECPSEGDAIALKKKIEAWRTLNTDGAPFPRLTEGKGGASNLTEAAIAWGKDALRTMTPRTVEHYMNTAERFIAAHGGDRATLASLTTKKIEAWDATHAAAGVAPSSRRRMISVLMVFQAWAWKNRSDWPGLTEAPVRAEQPKAPAPRAVAPRWSETDAMIARLDRSGSGYRAAWLARCTGLRASQIGAMRWSHVDLDRGLIVVVGGKTAQEKAERREIPLAPVLIEEMRTWTRTDDRVIAAKIETARPVVLLAWRRAMAAGLVRPEVFGASEKTGRLAGCSLHALRRGFVTGLHRLDADTEGVEYLVGHSRGVSGIRGRYMDVDALNLAAVVALVPAYAPPDAPETPANVVPLRAAAK